MFVASGDGADLVDPGKLVDEVATAVWEGDVRRLAEFAAHPSIRISSERMALQIVGCDDAIVGHVPIGSRLLAAVTVAAVEEP